MPGFFIPFTPQPEEAETKYAALLAAHHYPVSSQSRLFRLGFQHAGRTCVAEVGKEIEPWAERTGCVLGIIESDHMISIFTFIRNGLAHPPILCSPEKVTEREYFEDFSPLGAIETTSQ